jgi:predicted unusual protein kinase regulating ubiquinone biosynthesis (AarF/ABC1/UbiB family)
VVLSYLSVRLQGRFRSPAAVERILQAKHVRNARRIERTIVELRGLFIKVGQLISIMTNFLPAAFREQLERLQDQVPPRPFADIERRIRDELGAPPSELFSELSELPVASASIGQVHRARLLDGRPVAVKVQYPEIEEIVRIDLRTLQRIFRLAARLAPNYGLEQVYREIRDMVLQELDFREEARNSARIASNFEGHADLVFPTVIGQLSTARVLTTEWLEGIKINDVLRLDAAGVDRKALAKRVVSAYCKQIFSDGVYHADPHPGNILVQPGTNGAPDRVVFLDFGAVAQVSDRMRRGMASFVQGAIARDNRKVLRAMREMGFLSRTADPAVFDRVVEFFHDRLQQEVQLDSFTLKEVRFDAERGLEDLADLRKLDVSIRDITNNFHVPKEWVLLERTVLLLMGLCTELDHDMNPMAVIRPYLTEFVLGKDQDWSRFVVNATKELAVTAAALPAEMQKFMTAVLRGQVELRVRHLDDGIRVLYALAQQVVFAAVGLVAAIVGFGLRERAEEPLGTALLGVAGASGLVVLLSMLAARGRLPRKKRG